MLATIRDDTWNVLNIQHVNPNSKRWDYSDNPMGPTDMVEGDHHLRKRLFPANLRCSSCSPLGEKSLWNGTIEDLYWKPSVRSLGDCWDSSTLHRAILIQQEI